MEFQQLYETQSDKSVCQLLDGVNFAYYLCFGHSIEHWKGMTEETNSIKCILHAFGYILP